MVLIFFVLIDEINSGDRINRINRINHINPSILNFSALQLKDNANDPTKSGMTFWGKNGNVSISLAFTVI